MNTVVTNAATGPSDQSFATTFAWLLKREYWEHRGGFFWAPIIISAVMLSLVVIVLISADFTAHQHGVNLNGMNLGLLAEKMSPENAVIFANGLDIGLLGLGLPIGIALTFVVFFYLLGALYDDRRDRSVLFWKSLPVSDLNTVLSKVVAAVVIAPVMAVAAIILLQLAFLVLASLYAMLHGVNQLSLLWSPTHLLAMWTKLLLLIPINALWALPTVGWLLLCSSFARSKPFLWAVLLPLLIGFIVSWINLLQQLSVPSGWYWQNVFGRVVFGTLPVVGWLGASIGSNGNFGMTGTGNDVNVGLGMNKMDFINTLMSMDKLLGVLMSPQLWIGAVAGAAMIAAAVYFRQKRTEAYS
jgi:ABC-2 type transport system permease protein